MSSSDIEPLRYPDDWPEPSKFERWCLWIPVAGWIVAAVLEHRRTSPIVNELNRKFDARPPEPCRYWETDSQSRIAASIIESCVKACCWPHSHFIPDDSFGVMIEWRTGDGCEWDAMFRIEKALNVKFDKGESRRLCEMTLREAVDYLVDRTQEASTMSRYLC